MEATAPAKENLQEKLADLQRQAAATQKKLAEDSAKFDSANAAYEQIRTGVVTGKEDPGKLTKNIAEREHFAALISGHNATLAGIKASISDVEHEIHLEQQEAARIARQKAFEDRLTAATKQMESFNEFCEKAIIEKVTSVYETLLEFQREWPDFSGFNVALKLQNMIFRMHPDTPNPGPAYIKNLKDKGYALTQFQIELPAMSPPEK